MKNRRKARELALEALYRHEIAHEAPEDILTDIFSRTHVPSSIKKFAHDIVLETTSRICELDQIISSVAKNWRLDRIAIIEKNILRAAICELLYFTDIPPKASINEAIELAKKYSTAESGKFVNGILDRVMKNVIRNNKRYSLKS
ncbi:MAG: transcription antitermination factor NusB [bacterium]|nr:transcription antitermination factor NusB [bacterium]